MLRGSQLLSGLHSRGVNNADEHGKVLGVLLDGLELLKDGILTVLLVLYRVYEAVISFGHKPGATMAC